MSAHGNFRLIAGPHRFHTLHPNGPCRPPKPIRLDHRIQGASPWRTSVILPCKRNRSTLDTSKLSGVRPPRGWDEPEASFVRYAIRGSSPTRVGRSLNNGSAANLNLKFDPLLVALQRRVPPTPLGPIASGPHPNTTRVGESRALIANNERWRVVSLPMEGQFGSG